MVNINVKKVLAKLLSTRMVIESGTSGIWTYRKWSDGTAECWGTRENVSVTFTTWATYWAYARLDGIALPFTFAEIPAVFQSCYSAGGDIYALGASIANYGGLTTTTNTGGLTLYRAPSSTTIAVNVRYYVVGKWATIDTDLHTLDITGFSQQQMTKAEIRALIEGSGNIYKDNDTWVPSDLT